jgi:hypothetical protein
MMPMKDYKNNKNNCQQLTVIVSKGQAGKK